MPLPPCPPAASTICLLLSQLCCQFPKLILKVMFGLHSCLYMDFSDTKTSSLFYITFRAFPSTWASILHLLIFLGKESPLNGLQRNYLLQWNHHHHKKKSTVFSSWNYFHIYCLLDSGELNQPAPLLKFIYFFFFSEHQALPLSSFAQRHKLFTMIKMAYCRSPKMEDAPSLGFTAVSNEHPSL